LEKRLLVSTLKSMKEIRRKKRVMEMVNLRFLRKTFVIPFWSLIASWCEINRVDPSFIPVVRKRETTMIDVQRTLIIPNCSVPKPRAATMLKIKRNRPERV